MEQSKTTITQISLLASATKDEIAVAQLLLDLRTLLSLTESLASFNWGRRRRRSCLDENPSPGLEIKETRPRIEAAAVGKSIGGGGGGGGSPTTPLSFSPSESDDKSKCRRTTPKKRGRDEYFDAIEGLTRSRDVLRLEVENVKKFYSNLKSYNSKLKAIKQEMSNKFQIKEEPRLEIRSVNNFGADPTGDHRVNITRPNQHPHIPNPTAQHEFYYSIGPEQTRDCHASDSGPACAEYVGPLGIDLNFPAAEAFGLDSLKPLDAGQAAADRRAGFAEARRKRKGLMRAKSVKSGIRRNCLRN
ncbi:Unknown protein [Striga hermonthica]|uniref:Uncharacterized protein n=1 Tax=Striga hermonthica TaxID=68872 RepID=A0A9N7MQ17_STRHE|nr:Unknown protein [Striga hermonthica]